MFTGATALKGPRARRAPPQPGQVPHISRMQKLSTVPFDPWPYYILKMEAFGTLPPVFSAGT